LHGVTIEITEEQYIALKTNFQKTVTEQDNVFAEMVSRLHKDPNQIKPIEIYQEEVKAAESEARAPRLTQFNICPSLSSQGLTFEHPNNCKTKLIHALKEVKIPDKSLTSIANNSSNLAPLPRMSGEMEDIFLHSVGNKYSWKDPDTNQITFFRKWEEKSKLFWTLPPLVVRQQENETKLFDISPLLLTRIKDTISKLQGLEWVVVNAKMKEANEIKRNKLTDYITQLYSFFSTLTLTTDAAEIQKHLEKCDDLFFGLYRVVNDFDFKAYEHEAVAVDLDINSQEEMLNVLGQAFDYQVLRC